MKLLFLDTETGGLDPLKHSLLTIAAIVYNTETCIRSPFEARLSLPEYVVTPEAMNINKLDLVSLKEAHTGRKRVLADFTTFLHNAYKELGDSLPATIAGENISFDVNFLKYQLFQPEGVDISSYISYRVLDVQSVLSFAVSAGFIPHWVKGSKQANEYFGIKNENVHDAMSDCIASLELYLHLINFFE